MYCEHLLKIPYMYKHLFNRGTPSLLTGIQAPVSVDTDHTHKSCVAQCAELSLWLHVTVTYMNPSILWFQIPNGPSLIWRL